MRCARLGNYLTHMMYASNYIALPATAILSIGLLSWCVRSHMICKHSQSPCVHVWIHRCTSAHVDTSCSQLTQQQPSTRGLVKEALHLLVTAPARARTVPSGGTANTTHFPAMSDTGSRNHRDASAQKSHSANAIDVRKASPIATVYPF